MNRLLTLAYGVICYFLFFGTFLYLFGFTGDLLVPKSVSSGAPEGLGFALVVDLFLIALFGVQHSVMARPSYKKWWTKIVSDPAERSTYVLVSNLALILMFAVWQPLPGQLWDVSGTPLATALWVVFAAGFFTVFLSSFMINHFDLFGLRQVGLFYCGKPYSPVPFQVKGLYKRVRNPLMLGFLLSFWAAPVMTTSRLLLAAGMTAYIFIGIYFEERTNAQHLGEPYIKYRAETSMILPVPGKNKK